MQDAGGTSGGTSEAPLGRRTVALLVALVVVVKVSYLLEYAKLPFLEGPIFDSLAYLRQADAIRRGRFDDATLLAFSPLYGYFLAALGAPRHLVLPVVAQLTLGTLNLFLVARIARRLGARVGGIAAAAIYLGYGLLIYFESKLLSETLGLTLALVAYAAFFSVAFERGSTPHALAVGALLGLATLARTSLVFATPFFVLAALVGWERPLLPLRVRAARGAVLAFALAAVFGANGLWTKHHTGLFVPITYASGGFSGAGRTPAAAGAGGLASVSHAERDQPASVWDAVRRTEEEMARARRGETGGSDLVGALRAIDYGSWLGALPEKLARTFGDTETRFQYGYYGERSELAIYALMPLSFGGVLVLALAGAALLARREGARALVPHAPLFLGALATTTLYVASSRYRLPMVLPAIVLGGYAASEGMARIRARRGRLPVAVIALVVLGSSVRLWTYELRFPADWHLIVATSELTRGDGPAAAERVARARAAVAGDSRAAADTERRIDLLFGPGRFDP